MFIDTFPSNKAKFLAKNSLHSHIEYITLNEDDRKKEKGRERESEGRKEGGSRKERRTEEREEGET